MANFKKWLTLSALLPMFFTNVYAQESQKKSANIARPKVVIGLVVDQMRWDYLYRYYSHYGKDGFRRIMDEGHNCQQTFINYLPSFTAPGHAGIYTGSVPAIHGIAANDWIDNETGRSWYCVEDTAFQSVGTTGRAGMMSPRNLLVTTITDELRLATNMKSRTFGIALKDRGSILPAGHLSNGSYWYDDATGNFVTSSFYRSELPNWLQLFNAEKNAARLLQQAWKLKDAENTYNQSLPDDNAYEGKMKGETKPIFSHKSNGKNLGDIRYFPAGNELTFSAAKAMVKGEAIGKGDNTDFLCVSMSSTDYAGHRYAPNALEMEDMYIRLDAQLADFLAFLDHEYGKGNYTFFLSADHGGAHNSNYLEDLKVPAGAISNAAYHENVAEFTNQAFGNGRGKEFIRAVENYQVYLNDDLIEKAGVDRAKVKNTIQTWLKKQVGVAMVIDMEDMDRAATPEPIKTMAINGYNRHRSGVLQIILQPAWYSGYRVTTGTTHGSWNPYDTHIPLVWFGWGIKKGNDYEKRDITDIAATLAALLHVQMPNGCVGEVITQSIK